LASDSVKAVPPELPGAESFSYNNLMNEALNPRQDRFVDEYLLDGNGTQAAIRAGYSAKTAYSIASENLRKPDIQQAIAERQRQLAEKRQWDRERLVSEAESNLHLAREHKQMGSANGALELIGRVTGLLNEKQQQQSVTVTKITVITTDAAMPRAEIVEAAHRPSLEAPES